MSHDPGDPVNWHKAAASNFTLGLDLGFAADHSALVVGGVWPGAQSAIGVFDIRQLPLGTPMNEVADAADCLRNPARGSSSTFRTTPPLPRCLPLGSDAILPTIWSRR